MVTMRNRHPSKLEKSIQVKSPLNIPSLKKNVGDPLTWILPDVSLGSKKENNNQAIKSPLHQSIYLLDCGYNKEVAIALQKAFQKQEDAFSEKFEDVEDIQGYFMLDLVVYANDSSSQEAQYFLMATKDFLLKPLEGIEKEKKRKKIQFGYYLSNDLEEVFHMNDDYDFVQDEVESDSEFEEEGVPEETPSKKQKKQNALSWNNVNNIPPLQIPSPTFFSNATNSLSTKPEVISRFNDQINKLNAMIKAQPSSLNLLEQRLKNIEKKKNDLCYKEGSQTDEEKRQLSEYILEITKITNEIAELKALKNSAKQTLNPVGTAPTQKLSQPTSVQRSNVSTKPPVEPVQEFLKRQPKIKMGYEERKRLLKQFYIDIMLKPEYKYLFQKGYLSENQRIGAEWNENLQSYSLAIQTFHPKPGENMHFLKLAATRQEELDVEKLNPANQVKKSNSNSSVKQTSTALSSKVHPNTGGISPINSNASALNAVARTWSQPQQKPSKEVEQAKENQPQRSPERKA